MKGGRRVLSRAARRKHRSIISGAVNVQLRDTARHGSVTSGISQMTGFDEELGYLSSPILCIADRDQPNSARSTAVLALR